jgi:hypothetical protein
VSSVAVRTAFENRLRLAFPSVDLIQINNVNVEAPKDGSGKLKPFLGVFYIATEDARGLGRRWRESGTINILIYALAGKGAPTATADALRNIFAGKDLPVAPPGVRLACLDANPLSAFIGNGIVSGVYSVGMVAISYEYDFDR